MHSNVLFFSYFLYISHYPNPPKAFKMNHEVNVHIINAFCNGEDGGNPAGVVRYDGLSSQEKQRIASKVGL